MKKIRSIIEKLRIKREYEFEGDILDECLLTAGLMCLIIGFAGIASVLIN